MIKPIAPRHQQATIEVEHWEIDAEFGTFPQGARAKDAVFAPEFPVDPCIAPNRRYLFKRSKHSYPDQFWGEIVAYRVGCCMGLQVPPAFAAVHSRTGHPAALIEWFYDDHERFVLAGDCLQSILPDFDRVKGQQHNLGDATLILRLFVHGKILAEGWRQWLADMLLFDAVIGNTDRHQDNWGFVFARGHREGRLSCRFAPLFDNGTSLGHERFPNRVKNWTDADLDRYIARGTHHIGKLRDTGACTEKHADLVSFFVGQYPATRTILADRLTLLKTGLPGLLDDLAPLGGPVPFSPDRAAFVHHLLERRIALLQGII